MIYTVQCYEVRQYAVTRDIEAPDAATAVRLAISHYETNDLDLIPPTRRSSPTGYVRLSTPECFRVVGQH